MKKYKITYFDKRSPNKKSVFVGKACDESQARFKFMVYNTLNRIETTGGYFMKEVANV